MGKIRKPGGGRKKSKPEFDAGKNLKEQMDAAVALYEKECSLQDIADALNLNPIKVRKLLITAGVYESETADKVQDTFEEYRETQDYKTSILSTANTLKLSKASVTSYLPYKKGVYFPSTEKEKISVGAERQRRYRAMKRWRTDPTEENFWGVVLAYAGVKFKTYAGLPFTYEVRKGRNGEYTKELWIDRRENSKSLAWSSVLLAFGVTTDQLERTKSIKAEAAVGADDRRTFLLDGFRDFVDVAVTLCSVSIEQSSFLLGRKILFYECHHSLLEL